MNKLLLALSLIFSFYTALFSQIPQMRVVSKAELSQDEFVGSNIRDANGRICAAIKVLSNLEGLQYQSYNEIVRVDHKPGMDIVYLSPDERVLEIYKSGFEPMKLFLSELGIQLRSKQIWEIRISGLSEANAIPVTFLVQPSDASIVVDGRETQSEKPILLEKGSHQLKIFKEGYRTLEKTIQVDKEHVLFRYKLDEIEPVIVIIRTEPEGAQLYLNGVLKGETDLSFYTYPGKYDIRISKDGYLDYYDQITVPEKDSVLFRFPLTKDEGYVTITANPADAEIEINGMTVSSGRRIPLKSGEYVVKVSKPYYASIEERIRIDVGAEVKKSYTLNKTVGTLQLNVQPSTAKVLINKMDYSNRSVAYLAPGIYKIEVSKEGYYPYSETMTIKKGEEYIRNIVLKQITGDLRFAVMPVSAEVKLIKNGKVIDQWKGVKILKNLQVGNYTIEAWANGYSRERKQITIKENEATDITLKLEKGVFFTGKNKNTQSLGSLKLIIHPEGTRVTIDGIPLKDRYVILPVGKYTIKCSKTGYESASKTITIHQDNQSKLKISLNPKTKGKAFAYSLFIPGTGQSYLGRKKSGWFYRLLFFSGAAGAYHFTTEYNKSVDDYKAIRQQYKTSIDPDEVAYLSTKMDDAYKTLEDNEKLRNYFYIGTGAIWLLNILDVAIMPPAWKDEVSLSSVPFNGGIMATLLFYF